MNELDQAQELTRRGESDAALVCYASAIKDQKLHADALAHRAWLLRGLGRYEEAHADYTAYLQLRPNDEYAHAMSADIIRLCGEPQRALQLAMASLNRDPMNRQALSVISTCQNALDPPQLPQAQPPSSEKSIPAKPLNASIDALERDPRSFPGSIYPEIGRLLYSLVRCTRPQTIVETGCFVGYSTLCLAQAAEENGGGHVHSFDVFLPRPGYVSPVIGLCEDPLQAARAHLESANLSSRVTLHKGVSYESIPEAFAAESQPTVDFAFIDGDHTLQGALKDWNAVEPLIKPGGLIMFHDTEPHVCQWLGPRCLLEHLPNDANRNFHWVGLPSPEGVGVAIVQKRTVGNPIKWRPSLKDLLIEALSQKRFWGWYRPPKHW